MSTHKLTRRMFGKRMLAASALPVVGLASDQTANSQPAVPDTIAGYKLTDDDKQLTSKFLSNHEKNMMPLRAKELPNGLAPSFMFASPREKSEPKARRE